MKKSYIKDLVLGIVAIVLFYMLGLFLWEQFSGLLLQIPFVKYIYDLAMLEVQNKSLAGLSIMTFFGSLFFVAYPAELFYLVYVKIGYSLFYVALVMIFYSVLGQAVNYVLGYYLEEKFLYRFVKDKKKQYLESLKKYDAMFIITLNIVPLAADVLSLLLGIVKYDYKKSLMYTFIGKVLKFLLLAMLVWSMNGFPF